MLVSPERILILGLVLLASCSSGPAGISESPGFPIEDDFSECSTWAKRSDNLVSLGCIDGAYRVLVMDPEVPQNSVLMFSQGPEALRVESDGTYEAGPKEALYGVGCWASENEAYLFTLTPDGGWAILRENLGTSPPHVQLAGSDTKIVGLSATNRIRAECIGGAQEPTLLTLFVNSKKIFTAEDPDGFASFPGAGFWVFTSEGGTDVRFDNVAARALNEGDARASATVSAQPQAAGTSEEVVPSSPPEPPSGRLCKKDGIRYAGTTRQGVKVCFTLSRDRSTLLDIGLSFVRASGCPDMTVYSDDPLLLDEPGRIEIPGMITASIGGGRASGVLEDAESCPGKTFKWVARRVP